MVKDELDKLKVELEAKHIKFELIAGVVMTGGGAQIEDLKECASNVFHRQVRIASPLNITGLTDYVNRPQYSTVVGLLQYNHSNSDDDLISGNDESDDGILKQILNGIKKLWIKCGQNFDYFDFSSTIKRIYILYI